MKRIILVSIVLFTYYNGFAQSYVDNALLFSRTTPAGSARIQALGGAQIALGGDYSSALSNPAGLGMYNRSEFTFSPGLNILNSSSEYFGSSLSSSKSILNIPGISIVIHSQSDRTTGFLGGSFAVTMSRINDLNSIFRYRGYNSNNSILDYFIDDAGSIDPDEMLINNGVPGSYFYSLTGLAYNNYLIEEFEDDQGIFYNSVLNYTSSRQEEAFERKGNQNQWSIAYGANFSDKFFLGASIGIATLRYELSQVYVEDDVNYPDPAHRPLSSFAIDEAFDIKGSGVNFTLGATVRPVDFLQIGASIATPTYYQLTDRYSAAIESNWNNYDYFPDDSQDARLNYVTEDFGEPLLYEYNVTTPFRFRTGVAFINKIGFITTDFEFVNYTKSKYSSEIAGEFSGENNDIRSEFQSALNISVGAEYRLNNFRFRGGYNRMEDPYLDNSRANRSIQTLSLGTGYRSNKYFIDLAASRSTTEGTRIPYFVNNSTDPVADITFSTIRLMLTLGFVF